jgi:beta-glucosidase
METMMGGSAVSESRPNIDYTVYEEGIFVGYRYFDTYRKKVSYPFGFGLSYADFEYANAAVRERKGVYTVTVEVKNVGATAGKEVVQLYVSAPAKSMSKPEKELKAFAKTKLLQPQESQALQLEIAAHDLASYDENAGRLLTEAGDYAIQIGASSADVRQSVSFRIKD